MEHLTTEQPMKAAHKAVSLGLIMSMSVLAGCGGAPSSSDVRKLIEDEQEKSAQMMRQIGGKMGDNITKMMPVVEDVDVLGCEEQRENVYACDIEVTSSLNGKENSEVSSVTLAKNKNGEWKAI
jgi:hypothetical protein